MEFDVADFHDGEFPVESGEHGDQEVLLAFDPEIGIGVVVDPDVGACLPEHVEILSVGDEAKESQPSKKDQSLSTREAEVFIVR